MQMADKEDRIHEMEQIEKGLESFLDKELSAYRAEQESSRHEEYEQGDWEAQSYEAETHKKKSYGENSAERDPVREKREDGKKTEKGKCGNGKQQKQGGGKRKKRRRGWKIFFAVLLILLIVLVGIWYFLVNRAYNKMNYQEIESVADQPLKEQGITNVLLIGNDSRTQEGDGRSDAMLLLSINNKSKKIYLTSLLRDMYVEIPGHKANRLNAAYAFGGAELLIETLKLNLGIEVNRYVQVNFQAFANLIDAVGGVDLELTNDEVRYVNGYLVEYNILENRPEGTDYIDATASGMLHLNGPQALAYCRNRYLGTDFGRTERQRKVLTAAIRQAPMELVTSPDKLMEGIFPNLTTNLTKEECMGLSLEAPKVITYEIVSSSIPIEGSYSNATVRKMSVLQVDFEANKAYLQETIFGDGKSREE